MNLGSSTDLSHASSPSPEWKSLVSPDQANLMYFLTESWILIANLAWQREKQPQSCTTSSLYTSSVLWALVLLKLCQAFLS